jgi:hypothetical protein
VGIVNRSQEDINKNVDMIAARKREREFFATNPDYAHLASKMGSEYLARLLSKVCTRPCIIYSVGWAGFFGYYFLVTFHFICLLIKLIWFQHLESVIRARIPGIASFINRSIDDLEAELAHLGRPVSIDAGVRSILCYLLSI